MPVANDNTAPAAMVGDDPGSLLNQESLPMHSWPPFGLPSMFNDSGIDDFNSWALETFDFSTMG